MNIDNESGAECAVGRFITTILREAAFRAFIADPRTYGAQAVLFLRASQRYV